MKKIIVFLGGFFLMEATIVLAAPPKMEFYFSHYDRDIDCLSTAEIALERSGFWLKKEAYAEEDRVGTYGEYKGAVGCSSEVAGVAVFVVAGPQYKRAKKLAKKLQRNFN